MIPADPPAPAGDDDGEALLDEVENAGPSPDDEDRDVDSLMMQGLTLLARENYGQAEARFRAVLVKDPRRSKAHLGLGRILETRYKTELAILHFQTASAIDPANAEAFRCLGDAYLALGKSAPALAAYARALRVDAKHALAHYHEALALLASGKYARGWRGYEWRWRVPGAPERKLVAPAWDGKARTNAAGAPLNLLVEGEGAGVEAILCLHSFADLMASGVRSSFCGDGGVGTLLRRSYPNLEIVAAEVPTTAFDAAIPLGSLPGHLRRRPVEFTHAAGYLVADLRATTTWRERYRARGAGLKLGLAWRGEASWPARDPARLPLAALGPVFDLPGFDFASLEPEPSAVIEAHGQVPQDRLGHWPGAADLDALAARIDGCDLVVAPPGRIAALAGALGKKVFVLAPTPAGWPWLMRGRKLPWFPSAVVLRRQADQDWEKPIAALAAELRALQNSAG